MLIKKSKLIRFIIAALKFLKEFLLSLLKDFFFFKKLWFVQLEFFKQ